MNIWKRSLLLLVVAGCCVDTILILHLFWNFLRRFNGVVGTGGRISRKFLTSLWNRIFLRCKTFRLSFLSVLTRYFSVSILQTHSRELKGPIHHAVLELLCYFLLELFQLFFDLRINVARLLQISTSQTNCVSTGWTRSLSKHSVSYLAIVGLPINVFSNHGLRRHFILVLMVIFRRQQRTEEPTVILNIDRTERMANSNAPIICIVMVLTRMNPWSELCWIINLSGRLAPVTLLGSSLSPDHLIGWESFYAYFAVGDPWPKLSLFVSDQVGLLLC